jgi:hypothetical protein
MYVSHEAEAYLRAKYEAGLKLPKTVQDRADALTNVETQVAQLARPEEVPHAATLAASEGLTLPKAYARVEELERERERLTELQRIGQTALDSARAQLTLAVVEHRDEMMLSLWPVMTRLIKEARPLAEVLRPFMPNLSANAIVNEGEPKHLKAFQKAVALEKAFGSCMGAWRSSFQEARQVPYAFDVRHMNEAYHVFTHPDRVRNDLLAGRARNKRGYVMAPQVTILALASEGDDIGFRPALVSEVEDLFQVQTENERNAEIAAGGVAFGIRALS